MNKKVVSVLSLICLTSTAHTNIPSFVGDLVGRDLSGLGPLGHVGIATAPDYRMRPDRVLEAMHSVPHIQENSIENFKSRTSFWGSKGGLLSPKSKESFTVANRIVQQYYACPDYTITWRWREGKKDSKGKLICALFRCDTLVNYAYAFSKGYSLPTYNTTWTTPVAIYNYFPVDSDLFAPVHSSPPSSLVSTPSQGEDISIINEKNLKEIDAETFYQMLQNPSITKENIIYLWNVISSNHVDNDVKILFYDYISFENPHYLVSEIIKQAKKEKGEARHKLLVALQTIYQNNDKQVKPNEIQEISNYFKVLQYEDLNKDDAGIVFRGVAALEPESISKEKSHLTNMDNIHVAILLLQKDRKHSEQYVMDIITHLENPDDTLVVPATYQYLSDFLKNDTHFFSKNSKELFKIHLDKKNLLLSKESSIYIAAYVEFKAVLNAHTIEEIPRLINEYIALLPQGIQETTYSIFADYEIKKSY